MTKASKAIVTVVATIIVIAGCVYSGKVEYNDAILSSMSADKYDYIHSCLGSSATQNDVVKEYIANQKYYDSITK
nr:MAG TPA: hypothetical protein [Caudoviricetes sp.]